MRGRSITNRSLHIRDKDHLADHRLIVLLAALVEAQARPRSMRHQRRYDRRLVKWQLLPIGLRANALRRHSLRNSLTVKEELQSCEGVERWKYSPR